MNSILHSVMAYENLSNQVGRIRRAGRINGFQRPNDYLMEKIKTVVLMTGLILVTNVAVADLFTISGFTFNDDNSVTTAALVEGSPTPKIHSAPFFAGRGDLRALATKDPADPFLHFQREKTIGRLLGTSARRIAGNPSLSVSLPDKHDVPPWPNVDRCTIELTWGGKGLRNKPGNDFVVYEAGKFEGFSVAVRKAGSETFTPPRYHFADRMDLEHDVNPVAFDLSSFGLADGEMITAIRIRNLFNSEAKLGADKVDGISGEGGVLYPGDVGYSAAYTLTARELGTDLKADEGGGREFSTDSLDADIVFVVGLRDIEKTDVDQSSVSAFSTTNGSKPTRLP